MNDPAAALLFPGQGVQRSGMGEPWRDSPSWQVVGEVSEWTGEDVEELLLRADDETLRRTDLAQISVFTIALVTLESLAGTSLIERVTACAGHSLGEYAALVAADVLTPRDAAILVAARGRAMREATQRQAGAMAALIGAELDVAEALTAEVRTSGDEVWVANINAPGQVVVSGAVSGVRAVAAMAPQHAIKAIELPVAGAFHSPLMSSAQDGLQEALAATTFAEARVPVVANVDARPHVSRHAWPSLLRGQLTAPVRWDQTVRVLCDELGCECLVELGPSANVLPMVRRIAPRSKRMAITDPGAAERASGQGEERPTSIAEPEIAAGQPARSLPRSALRLRTRDGDSAVVEVDIDTDEPLFDGHFPGLRILPGVSLIECVQRAAALAEPRDLAGTRLSVIEKARFLSPVLPGDRVTVHLRWNTHDGGWRCAAELATSRGSAARVRLLLTTAEEQR